MAILNFTISPESLGRFHDSLVCLGKFSESVAIEATQDKVRILYGWWAHIDHFSQLVLTALNSSKSAYASFTLVGNKFFSKYQYRPPKSATQTKEKFTCKIYNKVSQRVTTFKSQLSEFCYKALLSVFKGRVVDPTREKDTAVERCDVAIEDGEGKAQSRFVVKMVCRHGMV